MRIPGLVAALLFAPALLPGMTNAQEYPNKPVRIVTATVGGIADVSARLIAQNLSINLGQQVLVENRGGETVAIEAVARARPDGYTVLLYGTPLWLTPLMRSSAPFNWERDFVPITLVSAAPLFMYTHPSLQARSIKELIALAKSRPADINYGTSGTGSATHLVAELFRTRAGVNITRIPYKGGSVAFNALLSGEIQIYFGSAAVGMAQVKAGKLRVLGVASLQPAPNAPDVPTMAAGGLPGFEADIFNGIFTPAKTPPEINGRLNREIVKVLEAADLKEKYLNAGMVAMGSTPEQLVAKIKGELGTLGKLIVDLNITDN